MNLLGSLDVSTLSRKMNLSNHVKTIPTSIKDHILSHSWHSYKGFPVGKRVCAEAMQQHSKGDAQAIERRMKAKFSRKRESHEWESSPESEDAILTVAKKQHPSLRGSGTSSGILKPHSH